MDSKSGFLWIGKGSIGRQIPCVPEVNVWCKEYSNEKGKLLARRHPCLRLETIHCVLAGRPRCGEFRDIIPQRLVVVGTGTWVWLRRLSQRLLRSYFAFKSKKWFKYLFFQSKICLFAAYFNSFCKWTDRTENYGKTAVKTYHGDVCKGKRPLVLLCIVRKC